MFDLLLMTDITPDTANDRSYTPLLLLLGARAEVGATCDEDLLLAALERLLAEGVALDNQDARGLSALHLASMHGLPRVVQRLLREGADRSLRDHLGRSPQELAVMRGYVDIAAEFDSARTPPTPLGRFGRDG
jgi:ankyrin repeat protein